MKVTVVAFLKGGLLDSVAVFASRKDAEMVAQAEERASAQRANDDWAVETFTTDLRMEGT